MNRDTAVALVEALGENFNIANLKAKITARQVRIVLGLLNGERPQSSGGYTGESLKRDWPVIVDYSKGGILQQKNSFGDWVVNAGCNGLGLRDSLVNYRMKPTPLYKVGDVVTAGNEAYQYVIVYAGDDGYIGKCTRTKNPTEYPITLSVTPDGKTSFGALVKKVGER